MPRKRRATNPSLQMTRGGGLLVSVEVHDGESMVPYPAPITKQHLDTAQHRALRAPRYYTKIPDSEEEIYESQGTRANEKPHLIMWSATVRQWICSCERPLEKCEQLAGFLIWRGLLRPRPEPPEEPHSPSIQPSNKQSALPPPNTKILDLNPTIFHGMPTRDPEWVPFRLRRRDGSETDFLITREQQKALFESYLREIHDPKDRDWMPRNGQGPNGDKPINRNEPKMESKSDIKTNVSNHANTKNGSSNHSGVGDIHPKAPPKYVSDEWTIAAIKLLQNQPSFTSLDWIQTVANKTVEYNMDDDSEYAIYCRQLYRHWRKLKENIEDKMKESGHPGILEKKTRSIEVGDDGRQSIIRRLNEYRLKGGKD